MLRMGTLGPSSCFVGDCHLPASQLFLPPRIGGGGTGPRHCARRLHTWHLSP